MNSKKVAIKDITGLLGKIVEAQERFTNVTHKIVNNQESLANSTNEIVKTLDTLNQAIYSLHQVVTVLVFLVLYLFWRVVLSDLVVNFLNTTLKWWQNLSENWQIAIVEYIFGIPTTIVMEVVITTLLRKLMRKHNDN